MLYTSSVSPQTEMRSSSGETPLDTWDQRAVGTLAKIHPQVNGKSANSLAQCGVGHVSAQVGSFKPVQGLAYEREKEKGVLASCEITFTIALCESRRTRLPSPPKASSVSGGTQAVVDLAWRTRLTQFLDEVQKRKDDKEGSARKPSMRTGAARFIVVRPSTSAVVDKGGIFYLAGKWKQTREGSSGSLHTPLRFLADIMARKILWASLGGVTHWISTPADSDLDPVANPNAPRMVVAWGQNPVNSESGLGPDEPKSCTKPTRHERLEGLHINGAHAALFLVISSSSAELHSTKEKKDGEDDEDDKYPNLPRWPDELVDTTAPASSIRRTVGTRWNVTKWVVICANLYHLQCLPPLLESVPEGEWFCPQCAKDPTGPIRGFKAPKYQSHWNGEEDEVLAEGRRGGGGAGGGRRKKKKSG
ncbi:hypothetical protein PM082_018133 [Marasmius tenuissimus]|nr:hypothetical protein PM082_018133 [Marasmius tenuissimus]